MQQAMITTRQPGIELQTGVRREDLYTGIHKAIRAMLCDVLVAVGRMDARDEADARATLGRVRQAIDLSRHHLHHENQHLHPAIEARTQGASLELAREHVEHEAAFERLEAAMQAVERSAGPAREAAALELYRELALYAAEDFRHMHVEETETNALLWESYGDAELKRIHHAIVASIGPEQMSAYLRWLVPAMTPTERAGMLSEMQGGMPNEVFAGVLELVKTLVDARDWNKLIAALGPRPMIV
jgi:hemerythrin-like domain-containing protein